MSLFERIKNIRYDLQEKRKFPGDESGAYKRAKTDIETKNLIKKAGGSGDIGFTAPGRKEKVLKRTTRAIKQGTPDPFEVDTSKAAKQTAKDFGTPTTKSQIKKLSKKPGGYSAPKGEFGPGITKGQANVKDMKRSAFKITKPSDIKLPKSFRDFQRNLQDYKDRDVPGGPKKYKQTELKFSSKKTTKPSGSRFDPDIGMAPPDKSKPKTKGVKQSEVSKKAKDFTTKINQERTKKVTPTTTTSKPKTTNVFKRITAATSGKKVTNSKGIGNQFRGKENKAAKDAMIKSQRDAAGMGGGKPSKPPTRVGQKGYVRIPKRSKFFQKSIDFSKVPDDPRLKGIEKSSELRRLNKQMGQDQLLKAISRTKIGKKIASTKAGKLAIKGTSAIAKSAVKNPYTAAATVVGAGLLTQPNVRKGIKAALTGGGIGALTGAFAKDNRKNKPAEYGKKTYIKKGSISLSPPAPKETNYSKTMSSVKPYDFTKINKKIKADQTAKKNALSASEKQKQRRGIA